MSTESASIREQGAGRARAKGVAIAGLLLPAEAHALMNQGVKLIDVRTRAEWDWVGRIPGAHMIEWNNYPEGRPNPDFLTELSHIARADEPLMFICRSGARSQNAAVAATKGGFAECYNVLEGFEGDRDAAQHRNHVGGWRHARLPWLQG